jgi:inner membrane protein
MRNSAIARLVIMSVLTVGLLVPLMWVYNVVSERASRRNSAIAEVSASWGGQQVIGGPVLSVPYSYPWTDSNGRAQRSMGKANFLPRALHIEGSVVSEIRSRGIFDVVVYRSNVKITGTFVRPDVSWIRPVPDRIDWDQAVLQVGVSDPRGLTRRAALTWQGQTLPLSGGVDDVGLIRSGVRTTIPALDSTAPDTELPFELTLDLNGTRDIRFLPGGEETTVAVASAWPHPSFIGPALPETRDIGANGFAARWRVQDFGRPYPARWLSGEMNGDQLAASAAQSAFGLSLVQPVDIYQQAERAVKYAVLFIVLTFMVFFLWEVFSPALLHPVQYAFVGFAMCVFYLLLVSIAEHAGFDVAYAISSGVTTALIAAYGRAVLGGTRQGASVLVALATLYGFLYLLLRLEDFALLAGSVGIFLVLAVVMFVTRRMDWYELKLGERPTANGKRLAANG